MGIDDGSSLWNSAKMTLKSNFEEIPALLAPPSYLDSTATDDQVAEKGLLHPRTNIAPRYTAWKLVLDAFIGTAYRAAPAELDHRQVSQDLFKWLQPQTYIEDEIGKA